MLVLVFAFVSTAVAHPGTRKLLKVTFAASQCTIASSSVDDYTCAASDLPSVACCVSPLKPLLNP